MIKSVIETLIKHLNQVSFYKKKNVIVTS